MNTTTTDTNESLDTAAALRTAAYVADKLAAAGCKVIGHYSNGRRAVLLIDNPPSFLQGVLRRREPDGQGGINRVLAAPYHGCQVEWRTNEPSLREVRHG